MAKSQNGWPASPNPDSINIEKPKVPGTNVDFPQGVRGGDVETVLMYVAEQFHKHVEPLHDGWCWGYAYREIIGGGDLSNHSSGTAIDLNAPRHPLGQVRTFTTAQVAKIREILNFCAGVVRWGGDYSGRKDEMHFEINKDAAAVAALAKKINAIKNPPPAPVHVVAKGDEGIEVKHIQQFFNSVFPSYRNSVSVKRGSLLTVDGDFGDQTEAWVKEFQGRVGLDDDGRIGPLTFKQMDKYGYKPL